MSIEIHPTAVIHENVIIEDDVYIGPNCTIGFPAEDKKTFPKLPFSVHISAGTKITGNVTVDAGTIRHTCIGNDCFIMKGSHIGHDCQLSNNVMLSAHSCLAGHVLLEEGVYLGVGAIIHPRQVIGAFSMIGMGSVVHKNLKVYPGSTCLGNPARVMGINKIGLERNNINEKKLADLKCSFEKHFQV